MKIKEDTGAANYSAHRADRPRQRTPYRAPAATTTFAEPARGYLMAGDADVEWLRGLEEGITRPFRDAAAGEPVTRSGLAGLSHTLGLPRRTTEFKQPIYFTEVRAPIYQPRLDFAGLESLVIPWLAPSRTQPRLPTDAALKHAVETLLQGAAADERIQWLVPAGGVSASVGDRAGIVLARLSRLESPLPQIDHFDFQHERFGRPGHGSTWSVRTERTPRPGPLPVNEGDPERDRRPCASILEPLRPLEVLHGPADTLSGEPGKEHGEWVVKFVAAAEWDGMITERSDVTVALDVEIDVDMETAETPWKHLQRLLLPPVEKGKEMRQASAEFVAGPLVIPFKRMHVRDERAFEKREVAGQPTFYRGSLRFVLDADLGGPSTPLSELLEASTALPSVEVRLTVQPATAEVEPTAATQVPLSFVDPATPQMPNGPARPPVTLRLPLAPVVRSRGALPLPVHSLLFIDPAYDRILGSAPAAHHDRVARPRFATPGASLPAGRGELIGSLYADRARVNRGAGLVFMADLALEKPRSPLAARADADGDLVVVEKPLALTFAVTTSAGERRELYFGVPALTPLPESTPLPEAPLVHLATAYELSFSLLREKDGTAARLLAGDTLELTITEQTEQKLELGLIVAKLKTAERLTPTIAGADKSSDVPLHGLDASGADKPENDIPFSRAVRILLTDEPVIEPSPTLYAALARRSAQGTTRLSLPLYAQSPLPWRVELRDAKADFRLGFVRRAATFIWSLARPSSEAIHTGIHIVKADRNGQTYLPPESSVAEAFIPSRFINPKA